MSGAAYMPYILSRVLTIKTGGVHQLLGDTTHVEAGPSQTPRGLLGGRVHKVEHAYLPRWGCEVCIR